MVAVCVFLAGWAMDRAEVGAFTESLAKLRAEFRTVEIDFTLRRTDAVFKTTREYSGKFRMLREPDGALYGLLQLSGQGPNDVVTYVLRGGELSEYVAATKGIRKLDVTKTGVLDYVARNWQAAVWLLDPAEAGRRCEVRVWKRDEHYTYLAVKTESSPALWFKDGEPRKFILEYRLAVMARGTAEFPRHALRQVGVIDLNGDTEKLAVTRWVIDGPGAKELSAKDFPDPAKPPTGWKGP